MIIEFSLEEKLGEVLLWEGGPEAKLEALEDLGRQALDRIERLKGELETLERYCLWP